MKNKRDLYEVLGIPKGSNISDIKKAYRRLAKKYHPDTNKNNTSAEERFKEVTEAYSILSDEKKKELYDKYGFAGLEEGFDPNFAKTGGHSYSYNGPHGSREFHFEGHDVDIDDIMNNLFGHKSRRGGFGSSLFGFDDDIDFGHGASKGSDLNAEIEVSFDEAAFGGKRKISLQSSDGSVRTYEVNIPAGISSGQSIRLKGKGNPGRGGNDGDLMLKVEVKDKPGFHREGQDVYTAIKIPYSTAVLGGETTVQTIYGNVSCRIKEGTQSGSKIRLKGKGIVQMNKPNNHGDQFVTVEVEIPKNLTSEEKIKLKEYCEACKHNGHVA